MSEQLDQAQIDFLLESVGINSTNEPRTKSGPTAEEKFILSKIKWYLKNKNPTLYKQGKEYYIKVDDLTGVYVNYKHLVFKK
jgi:hypothetical protein